MDRKEFMKRLGLLALSGAAAPQHALAGMPVPESRLLQRIGIQLFSLPSLLEKDFEGTIAMLAGMGFRELELFGPYPYSTDSAKDHWNAVTPMLGFSGSGYFGHSEVEVKRIISDLGLEVPSVHTDLDTLENKIEALGYAAETMGFEYAILPSIPPERRKTLEDYKRMADTFNTIGGKAKKEGIKFAYHNHGYGLSPVEGQIPLELLLDHTDPELVFLEMDLFWTVAGRADPIYYLKKYNKRYRAMHVKDMKEKKTFSGDGGDPGQWIPLFPNMTSAGDGVLDLRNIVATAIKSGVTHFYVEQDMVQDPETALKRSFDYLSSL